MRKYLVVVNRRKNVDEPASYEVVADSPSEAQDVALDEHANKTGEEGCTVSTVDELDEEIEG